MRALASLNRFFVTGIVDAVGAGVEQFQIGDRVSTFAGFSMSHYGVYGESAIVPVDAVAAFPSNLSFAQGAAIWMSYLTAYGALLHYGQITPTDFVLVTAATSSVGYSAIQLAKTVGATVIATTRTFAKKQALLDAGADFVIATQEENLESCVLEISNGHGADLIFDGIAGAMLESLANVAAVKATIFVYGALSSETVTPFPLFSAIGKGLKIQGYTMGELQHQPNVFEQAKRYIYEQLKSGSLKPVIDSQTFPLNAIAEAHRYMESNRQIGKIIVTVCS